MTDLAEISSVIPVLNIHELCADDFGVMIRKAGFHASSSTDDRATIAGFVCAAGGCSVPSRQRP